VAKIKKTQKNVFTSVSQGVQCEVSLQVEMHEPTSTADICRVVLALVFARLGRHEPTLLVDMVTQQPPKAIESNLPVIAKYYILFAILCRLSGHSATPDTTGAVPAMKP